NDNDAAIQSWAQGLATIAEAMREKGFPRPMEVLTGRADSPVQRWTQVYRQAQERAGAGEYAETSGILAGLLNEMAGARGRGVDDLAAKVHGLLGTNAMHLGDFAASVRHTEQALRLCTTTGDREGVAIYRQNLDLAWLIEAAERQDPNALRAIALR